MSVNAGCSCESCHGHYALVDKLKAEVWSQPIDAVKLARYVRAKQTGKIPSDPAYAAHVRHSKFVPNLEFTRAELTDRSVKVYRRTASLEERSTGPDRKFPNASVTDIREYVQKFEQLNNLVSTMKG